MKLFPWANEEMLVMAKTKEIKIKITKPRLVAYTVHKGSYSLLGEVFKKMAQWICENGYEIVGLPTSTYYNEA
jgi:effector-binding domain-containing protein